MNVLQFFFILVIMALIGNVIALAFAGNPSLINYDMFVAAFSMLSLFYLFAAAWSDSFAGHPIIPIVLDALNVLFLFCAAVATAAELGVHSCSNDVRLLLYSLSHKKKASANNSLNSLTPSPTTSPTEPTIDPVDAANCKLPPPSSGSPSPPGLSASSSRSSVAVVAVST